MADPKALDPEAAEEEFDEDILTDEDEISLPTHGLSCPNNASDDMREQLANLQDSEEDSSTPKAPSRRRFFTTLLRARFQRVICDEGHRVKTISSRQHQSVSKLSRKATWFLTATPMWNKPLDFCGQNQCLTDVNDYRMWSEKLELPTADLPYNLLSPAGLLSLSQNGHLTSQIGFDCLPIILRLTCLCREPGHTMVGDNGATIEIGGDIPPLAVTTVELRYTCTTQVSHDQTFHRMVGELYEGAAEDIRHGETIVAINWATFRQLCHLAVNPKLDVFLRRSSSRVLSADINAFGDSGDDRGFGLLSLGLWRTVQQTFQQIGRLSPVILPTTVHASGSFCTFFGLRARWLSLVYAPGSWSTAIGPLLAGYSRCS
ncbi:Helicase C-terminal [Penicillium pulvis]|uniref:Helicase C-terminal n=1 Tax=Penicillium pulvis TaxID=1562058 RepID=UPI00254877D3|nr:Helicase C-terminal [Penicillium pulvis]KAJ5802327.1 Helicase C-terminal [Penicillium pulvis]